MTLSPKQKKALKDATPQMRKKLLSVYQKQASLARPKASPQKRSRAPAPRPRNSKVPRPPRTMANHPFNAFNKVHLPTTERTAPYLTTTLHEFLDVSTATTHGQLVIVAQRSVYDPEHQVGPLSDFIAFVYDERDLVSSADASLITPMTSSRYARHQLLNAPTIGSSIKFFSLKHRLHKLSAKIECLGTDTAGYPAGDTWIGRVPMIETGSTSSAYVNTRTYFDAYVAKARSVGMIRSVPNSVLQKHPITIHAIVNESVEYAKWHDMFVPSTSTELNRFDVWPGLTPLLFYIPALPGDATVKLRINIAMQFCSRHPDDVVARAAQVQHEPTPASVWNSALSTVEDAGDAVAAFDAYRAVAVLAA